MDFTSALAFKVLNKVTVLLCISVEILIVG